MNASRSAYLSEETIVTTGLGAIERGANERERTWKRWPYVSGTTKHLGGRVTGVVSKRPNGVFSCARTMRLCAILHAAALTALAVEAAPAGGHREYVIVTKTRIARTTLKATGEPRGAGAAVAGRVASRFDAIGKGADPRNDGERAMSEACRGENLSIR